MNPDSVVEREAMSKVQTFRSEDMPFGIANGKLLQITNSKLLIPESGFWNLKFVVWNSNASEDAPGLPLAHCPTKESGMK